MIQITEWLRTDKVSLTVYGWITNEKWLEYEKARLEESGRECEIKQLRGKFNLSALFSTKPHNY